MKYKIITRTNTEELQDIVNDFMKKHSVTDISFTQSEDDNAVHFTAYICYDEYTEFKKVL